MTKMRLSVEEKKEILNIRKGKFGSNYRIEWIDGSRLTSEERDHILEKRNMRSGKSIQEVESLPLAA